MYATLPLFCGVWYPTRLSSVGSDTPQDIVIQGLKPRKMLFCGVSDPADRLRPRGTRQKSFESLPFSLKEHFSKIVCMHKLHYPRHIWFMLKEPLSEKQFFVPRSLIPLIIRTRIWNCFRVWIGCSYVVDSWKKPKAKNLVLLSL